MFKSDLSVRRALAAALVATAATWGPIQAVAAPLPLIQIDSVSRLEGDSDATQFAFTVSLTSEAPAGGVSFSITTWDSSALAGVDYVARSLNGQTIAEGQSSFTFTVDVLGDLLAESPDEVFFVYLTNVANAVALNTIGQGRIVDDDVTLSVPEPSSLALALVPFGLLLATRPRAARQRA